MTKKLKFQLLTVLAITLQVFAFQNCSKNSFTDTQSKTTSADFSGNGGNYDGKISYIVADLQNLCGDGSLIRSRIDRTLSVFKLLRQDCKDVPVQDLRTEDIVLDITEQFLTYAGSTFTKVRDPSLQPFSSTSIWNTSLGSGAQWSLSTDLDTLDLRTPNGDINAESWSVPFFLSKVTDSARLVGAANLASELLRLPADFHLSGPVSGNKTFVFTDASKRWMYQFTGCRTSGSTVVCDYGIKDDTCSNGLGGFDLSRGLIRAWELEQGEIKHVLRFALPKTLNKSSGVVWPASIADFEGLATSSGRIPYGSTIGISSDVNIDSLGLSRGGRILAKALQEYGAIQRDSSGVTGGINFYAEEAAESLTQMQEMRADLAKIISVLKILRNQSPTDFHGGGARRQPALPPVDPVVCR